MAAEGQRASERRLCPARGRALAPLRLASRGRRRSTRRRRLNHPTSVLRNFARAKPDHEVTRLIFSEKALPKPKAAKGRQNADADVAAVEEMEASAQHYREEIEKLRAEIAEMRGGRRAPFTAASSPYEAAQAMLDWQWEDRALLVFAAEIDERVRARADAEDKATEDKQIKALGLSEAPDEPEPEEEPWGNVPPEATKGGIDPEVQKRHGVEPKPKPKGKRTRAKKATKPKALYIDLSSASVPKKLKEKFDSRSPPFYVISQGTLPLTAALAFKKPFSGSFRGALVRSGAPELQ
jgi:hypothetical protein